MNTVRIPILARDANPGGPTTGLQSIAPRDSRSQRCWLRTAGEIGIDRPAKEVNEQNAPVARSAKLELEPEQPGTLAGQATADGSGAIGHGIALQTAAQK
jgi:hypothetical protein